MKFFGGIKSVGTWVGIVRNLGWLAMVVAGAIYVGAKYAGSNESVPSSVSSIALGLVAFGAGLLVGTLTMQRRMSKTAEYSWESAEYLYEFDPADILRHRQTVRITIRANKHNVEMFKNRYRWTGVGDITRPAVRSPGHTLMTEISRDRSWREYYVVFDRPLRKGAKTEIEIFQELNDVGRTFEPMLAKIIVEPIGSLKLRVIFPQAMRPAEARAIEFIRSRGGGTEWEIADEWPVPIDSNTGEAVYEMKRPKIGARYQVVWDGANYPR
ncbi:hypothetical protein QLQ12_12500 [Actinoplanes sp. NEAU-A12]|uniref:DUF4178 domain-containing protein n=1 Tax=Actinoplanes sandaracinus TaxID=3045177 RepID=A0ABT6WI71_9ACTN|nr:hypothetical protein [Actinoplanes sandaracinus]MDI6099414.1 hypothetical protein [Actinoplanes sandaracinus]